MSYSQSRTRYFKVATSVIHALRRQIADVDSRARELTESQMSLFLQFYEKLGSDYNKNVTDEPLMVSVSQRRTERAKPDGGSEIVMPIRMLVSTSFWTLSIRAYTGIIECFILPSTEQPTLARSELPSRVKLVLKLADTKTGAWALNEAIVTSEELHILLRGVFKDVVSRTKTDYEHMPSILKQIASGQSFAGSVRSLLAEKHALVQKVVDQQEAIQGQLARELHDSVLGNVMLLKRQMSSPNRMSDEEMISVLQDIADRLREVCQDLSPRDLKDCGLRIMLQELCDNFAARTQCECEFTCPDELPNFPHEIALHLYRIAQECLNNVAKHASASAVQVDVEVGRGLLTMSIADNGVGFDVIKAQNSKSGREGGSGAGIIRERVELIGSTLPAKVWFDSYPGKGTKLTLEMLVYPD
ncbi:MAG TPA: sensor histidine kinase [Chroococcales cyanobacterium]